MQHAPHQQLVCTLTPWVRRTPCWVLGSGQSGPRTPSRRSPTGRNRRHGDCSSESVGTRALRLCEEMQPGATRVLVRRAHRRIHGGLPIRPTAPEPSSPMGRHRARHSGSTSRPSFGRTTGPGSRSRESARTRRVARTRPSKAARSSRFPSTSPGSRPADTRSASTSAIERETIPSSSGRSSSRASRRPSSW